MSIRFIVILFIVVLGIYFFSPKEKNEKISVPEVPVGKVQGIVPKSEEPRKHPEPPAKEPANPAQAGTGNSQNRDQKNTAVAEEKPFVDETFPQLDTYEWLMGSRNPDEKKGWNTVKVRDKFANKFKIDAFYGRRLQLYNLSKGDTISFHTEQKFLEILGFTSEGNQSSSKFIFNQKKLLPNLPSIADVVDLPICIVNTDFSSGVGNRNSLSLEIVKVEHPLTLSSGYTGVRLMFKEIKEPRWLKAIECYVKNFTGEDYKRIAVVHLLATIGIHGNADHY